MTKQYIEKSALLAEIDEIADALYLQNPDELGDEVQCLAAAQLETLKLVKDIIHELKEVLVI